MRNAKAMIAVTALICAGFEGTCSSALRVEGPTPTVLELLDIYREKMDQIKSYICETETFYTDKMITLAGGTKIRNEGIAPSTVQMRTDGDRFYICERDPTGLEGPERVVIPNDTRSRTWLWDGKYYYLYGQQTEQYAQEYAGKYINKENLERFVRAATDNVTIYVDVTFKRFDGIWFVAQQDFQYFRSGGRWSEDRNRYRLTRFVLNPDHDELKSFETNFADGAVVRLFVADGISRRQHFAWQGGKVVNAEGKQINLADVCPLPTLMGGPLPQLDELGLAPENGGIENKPILVCFWDMEQRTSRNCVLALRDRSAELARHGIFVVLVHDATIAQEALNTWINKSGISFASVRIASDAAGIRRNWRVKALPWLILTDREHVVVAEGFALDELDEKIEPINKKH